MKLFVVLSRVPFPLDKGDKLRAYNQIKQLAQHHKVVLLALNDTQLENEAITELKKYCVAISVIRFHKLTIFFNLVRALFSGLPFQVGYFYFGKAQKKVDELIKKHQPDHIYCQLIRTAEYVKKHTLIPKTLDYMDVFSKGMERRIDSAPFYMKPLLWIEYKRLVKYERKVFGYFNNKIIISEQDKNLIPHPKKEQIQVVPNGVDTVYFKPVVRNKEYDLLFNGNMNYPPNIESVEYLVTKIMPIVWQTIPDTRVLISGVNPHVRVLALKSAKVEVSGWVDDIRENFAKSKLLVAPMQISIGLQNKLLEAMAMQLPCITSSLANNALGAIPNEQIIVSNTPEEYATAIINLLQNPEKARKIALSGYKYAITHFNWTNTTAQLDRLFHQKNNK